ncbi:peptidoglycan DD-metalloendopeptidase family protein [Flavobacterium caeni]|uniref:Peptidase family M23 n=1 Tax=Flavobacterium caeni TaxID=490189 RepID=A0A1G5BS17_9FLAO|nr:peptidoglycan DD-metalloendopeptidase family protein [Flavobacterium caeni]SCX92867.1 Peptidase family M23 [Flavobacterium caeni]
MNALQSLLFAQTDVKVVNAKTFLPLDLSAANQAMDGVDVTDAEAFENHLKEILANHGADAAFGGYNETRALYKRSALFYESDAEQRNIHIGLDIWMPAGTAVLAPLDGTVHSFDYNAGLGDYGPTIILEHQLGPLTFYTLYGHLSVESIAELEIGDRFLKGQKLAELGDASVNGDYAPHLHFQIIRDIGDWFGDYPGVCSAADLGHYLDNCPDPNLLLKLK